MAYSVIIGNAAEKDLRRIVPPWDKKVLEAMVQLEVNPRPSDVKKLKGTKDEYRIRVADYRIIYTINDKTKSIHIFKIRHRREVYR